MTNLPHYAETWLHHPTFDDYWQHGSVCCDYDAIKCPVLLVGGWADPYRSAMLRLLDNLSCFRRAIIGPWSHGWPDDVRPGPQIGLLAESVRWWRQWLANQDQDIDSDPTIRYWVRKNPLAKTTQKEDNGYWAALNDQAQIAPLILTVYEGSLSPSRSATG